MSYNNIDGGETVDKTNLENIIREVIREMTDKNANIETKGCADCDGMIEDITTKKLSQVLNVPNPKNREAYMELKKATPARLGVWRAGPRLMTSTLLRFRADHAAAMDAVFNEVDAATLERNNLFSVHTTSKDKVQFLSNPATGKFFDEENTKIIKEKCVHSPQVQIIVADGLSSTSIEENIDDILPSLIQGLKGYGFSIGTPFFIKHGRVGSMDAVTEILNPDVTVILIGERPGLVTFESMSCYMTYKGFVGMPESMRTVVSNIYKNGTPPAEAGAHIADIVKLMIERKVSGLDLKL